jgi:hypothetical protein
MANEVIQISQQTDQRAFENPEALGEGTDFQDLIYDNALSQSYSLNAGGGNEGTTYYVSGSWSDGESIVRDTDTERMSVRLPVAVPPTVRTSYG